MLCPILISDLENFGPSIVGIFLSIRCIWIQSRRSYHTHQEISTEQEKISKWLEKDDEKQTHLNLILKDYEITNDAIGRRDNITLLVGSILITSSFLILANVALKQSGQPTFIFSIASIGLFSIWLLVLHDTNKTVNDLIYRHIKAIEGAIRYSYKDKEDNVGFDFGNNLLIVEKTNDQSASWLRLRRMFWGIVLLLLSISWFLVFYL